MTLDWDDPDWGGRVHIATWAPDPKHADDTEEE
jgi:hypothetical protein